MGLTKITQGQLELGSETAVDLLAMQNGWKKEMITALNEKIPEYASSADTMPVLVEKFRSIVQDEDSDSGSGPGYFSVFGRYLSCPKLGKFYLTGQPLKGSWSISVRRHCDFRNWPDATLFGVGVCDPLGDSFAFDNLTLLTWNGDTGAHKFFLSIPQFSGGSWDQGQQDPVSFEDQLDDSFPVGRSMYDVSLSYDADARSYSVSAALAGDPSVRLSVEFAGKSPLPFGEDGKNTYLVCPCPPFGIFDFSGFRFFNDGQEVFGPSVFPEDVGPGDTRNSFVLGPNLVNFQPEYDSRVILVSDICNNRV